MTKRNHWPHPLLVAHTTHRHRGHALTGWWIRLGPRWVTCLHLRADAVSLARSIARQEGTARRPVELRVRRRDGRWSTTEATWPKSADPRRSRG